MKGTRRGRGDRRFWLAAVVSLTTALLLAVGSFAWRCIWIARLSAAVTDVADTTLGDSPSVATIMAARQAILDVARERGAQRPVLLVALVRRAHSDGPASHVVAFELCSTLSHPTYERDLRRLLGPEELVALNREEICEASGPRSGHGHR